LPDPGLFVHPIISVNTVKKMIVSSYPTANDLVQRMVEAGILSETTQQVRNRRFVYQDYLDLFGGK